MKAYAYLIDQDGVPPQIVFYQDDLSEEFRTSQALIYLGYIDLPLRMPA